MDRTQLGRQRAMPPPDGARIWQPPTERMRETGPTVNREQIADTIKRTAAATYRSRTYHNDEMAFGALKKAVDEALNQLRPRGLAAVADHLFVRIGHFYTINHAHGHGMRAIEAFYQAVEDGLKEFVEQGA